MTEGCPPVRLYDWDDDLVVATGADRRPHMRISRPCGVMVVLGRSSRPEQELEMEALLRDSIPLFRRRGGGCAVLLDPGCVIVSVALWGRPGHGNDDVFAAMSDWMIEGLSRVGFEGARREGSSDIVMGDRKIAGACLHRSRDVVFYSASLLVAPRVDLMEAYLKHPPREPRYRRGRGHAEFIGEGLLRVGRMRAAEVVDGLKTFLRLDGIL